MWSQFGLVPAKLVQPKPENPSQPAPAVVGGAPNYLVYVVRDAAGASASPGSMMQGDRTLYAFYPNGSLKFKVNLRQ